MSHPRSAIAELTARLHGISGLASTDIKTGATTVVTEHRLTVHTSSDEQHLPSMQPIDHRWDRSRGIVFSSRCQTQCDQAWTPNRGITFVKSRYISQSTKRSAARNSPSSARELGLDGGFSRFSSGDLSTEAAHAQQDVIESLKRQNDNLERENQSLRARSQTLDATVKAYQEQVASLATTYKEFKTESTKQFRELEIKHEKLKEKSDEPYKKLEAECEKLRDFSVYQQRELESKTNELLKLNTERRATVLEMEKLSSKYHELLATIWERDMRLESLHNEHTRLRSDHQQYKEASMVNFSGNQAAVERLQADFMDDINPILKRLSAGRKKNRYVSEMLRREITRLREAHHRAETSVTQAHQKDLQKRDAMHAEVIKNLESHLQANQNSIIGLQTALDGRHAREQIQSNYESYKGLFDNLVNKPRSEFHREAESAAEGLEYWEQSMSRFEDIKVLLQAEANRKHENLCNALRQYYSQKIEQHTDWTGHWRRGMHVRKRASESWARIAHHSRELARNLHFNEGSFYRQTELVLGLGARRPHSAIHEHFFNMLEGPPKDQVLTKSYIRMMLADVHIHSRVESSLRRWEALDELLQATSVDRAVYALQRDQLTELKHLADKVWESDFQSDGSIVGRYIQILRDVRASEFEMWTETFLQDQLQELTIDADEINRRLIEKDLARCENDIKVLMCQFRRPQRKQLTASSDLRWRVPRIRRDRTIKLRRENPANVSERAVPSASTLSSKKSRQLATYSELFRCLQREFEAEKKAAIAEGANEWRVTIIDAKMEKANLLFSHVKSGSGGAKALKLLAKGSNYWRSKAEELQKDYGSGDSRMTSSDLVRATASVEFYHRIAVLRELNSNKAGTTGDFNRNHHAGAGALPKGRRILNSNKQLSLPRPRNFSTARASCLKTVSELDCTNVACLELLQSHLYKKPEMVATPESTSACSEGHFPEFVDHEHSENDNFVASPLDDDGSLLPTSCSSEQSSLTSTLNECSISRYDSAHVASDQQKCGQVVTSSFTKDEHGSALTYQLLPQKHRQAAMGSTNSDGEFWSHRLYRNPDDQSPTVYYCTSLETTERQSKLFTDEPIVGFDLEWEQFASLKNHGPKQNVSLVQIAAEGKIGLFHLACFKGNTSHELMAPSLRAILESPHIIKAGVNVVGDSNRLRQFFGINMKGLLELSHLYRVVKFSHDPSQVNFKLVSLASQVASILSLPLRKDDTRVSRWSSKLNGQQTEYAAADAYAGFRLYHELERLRKLLEPRPPRPAFYETRAPLVLGNGTKIFRAERRQAPSLIRESPIASTKSDEDEDEGADEYFDAAETFDGCDFGESETTMPKTMRGEVSYPNLPLQGRNAVHQEARSLATENLQTTEAHSAAKDETPSQQHKPLSSGARLSNADNPTANKKCPLSQCHKRLQYSLPNHSETLSADTWARSFLNGLDSRTCGLSAPQRRTVNIPSLRAYHLWYEQHLGLHQVAAFCREPPLALTTAASYVMTAITKEKLAFDKERIWGILGALPIGVQRKYEKIIAKMGE